MQSEEIPTEAFNLIMTELQSYPQRFQAPLSLSVVPKCNKIQVMGIIRQSFFLTEMFCTRHGSYPRARHRQTDAIDLRTNYI